MAICKKYAEAMHELINRHTEGKITNKEFGEKLIEYSDGDAPPCVNCKKREKCHSDVWG